MTAPVRARRRAAPALALALAACASFGGLRPREAPLAASLRLVTTRDARPLIVALDSSARAAGLAIVRSAPREGYLETAWFDLDRRASVREPFRGLDRIVKLRFFADPEQGRTRVLAECVVRIAWDPSAPPRELERMAPPDHPGRALLDSVLVGAGLPPPGGARRGS